MTRAVKLRFTKMQGTGNDFVVLDGVSRRLTLTDAQLRRLADRHFGAGRDQVLPVEPPRTADTDLTMRREGADNPGWLTGPALTVFEEEMEIDES